MSRKTKDIFYFKQFAVKHDRCAHKVGTDGVLLGAWVNLTSSTRILDVGTGSGVIALMLAQRSAPSVHIDAIEISVSDCEQAIENVAASPWPDKITVKNISLQELEATPYDLIVSNPPFFIDSSKPPEAERTRARHTETLSPEELIIHSRRIINLHGKLCLILPVAEAQLFIQTASRHGWYCTRLCEFRARQNKPIERLLIELQLEPGDVKKESLVLYEREEEWTRGYISLTRDFYLKI